MLMRTDPFRDLDRLTQQVLGTRSHPATMPIDAYRSDREFVVVFDVPGVDPDTIDVTVENNVLSVRSERQRADADQVEMLIAERPEGSFTRQLLLSESLDTDALSATCANGVLTLRIPIADRAKPRRIDVHAGDRGDQAIEAHARDTVGTAG